MWGVQWSNGDKSDFDINEMRKFCALHQQGFPRAASGLYSPLPAQPTRAEGREGGLLDTISWLASPAAGWLAFDFAFLLILI